MNVVVIEGDRGKREGSTEGGATVKGNVHITMPTTGASLRPPDPTSDCLSFSPHTSRALCHPQVWGPPLDAN